MPKLTLHLPSERLLKETKGGVYCTQNDLSIANQEPEKRPRPASSGPEIRRNQKKLLDKAQ